MTQARANPNFAPATRDWAELLRANCLTLISSQFVANSISLSRGFQHGMDTERESFVQLAQLLAEDYGLRFQVESHGYYVTIRFSRPEPETITSVAESDSIHYRAGAGLNARFGRSHQADGSQNDDRQGSDSTDEVRS